MDCIVQLTAREATPMKTMEFQVDAGKWFCFKIRPFSFFLAFFYHKDDALTH